MDTTRIAAAHLDSGTERYAQTIRVGHHTVTADERASQGGVDAGPAPYELLLAALGACTSITLRMYAERKGWELGPVHIDLTFVREGDVERIERKIRVAATLTEEQRARLGEIAEKTPVTKTVKRGTPIATTITT